MTTPQGTIEERFNKKFPRFTPFEIETVSAENKRTMKEHNAKLARTLSFIQSETSLSYQRGQDEMRERMRGGFLEGIEAMQKDFPLTHDMKRQCDFAYNQALLDTRDLFLALFKAKESNQK